MQFNHVVPRSRHERDAQKNKEIIEKRMINVRGGYEARNVDARDLIHNANPTSNYYLPENERFDHNFSAYDKRIREKERTRFENNLELRRVTNLEREQQKWQFMQQQQQIKDQNLAYKRGVLKMGKRNSNGMPYNPITLQYEESKEGEMLKDSDQKAEVRGMLRSENLDKRANCGYNILTGEIREGVRVPEKFQKQFQGYKKQQEEFYRIKAPHEGESNNFY